MIWPAPASIRAQAIIIAAASLAVAILAGYIIQDAVFTAEGKLRAEAERLCTSACQEIKIQYQDRSTYAGDPLRQLPLDAQGISLKAISTTVLQSYSGIRGGMYLADSDQLIGYAFPTAESRADFELVKIESDFVRSLARQANPNGEIAVHSERKNRDLIISAAARLNGGIVIWTMRRAPVVRYPLIEAHRWRLAALVLSVVLGMAGIISIWSMLNSGIMAIRRGLRRLETDFSYRLPLIRGDLGQVAAAINQMAERRLALESTLRQQDRLAALGRAVGGVAHEIRNPLNSIQLTLQLLERRLKKGATVSNEVQECLQEINRLDMIVERLLAFGRPEMMNRRTQELAPLIIQATKMAREPMQRKNVQIETAGLELGLTADVDGPQIIQVLINLLLNAIEASPEAGIVRLTIEKAETISIGISDEGQRIPDDVRPHIFDAYFTTKPNGTGLGLAVSREIVVIHSGSLEFESENDGTTFIMVLPADRSVAHES